MYRGKTIKVHALFDFGNFFSFKRRKKFKKYINRERANTLMRNTRAIR